MVGNNYVYGYVLTLENVPGKNAIPIPPAINKGVTSPVEWHQAYPVSIKDFFIFVNKLSNLNGSTFSSFKLSRKNIDNIKPTTLIRTIVHLNMYTNLFSDRFSGSNEHSSVALVVMAASLSLVGNNKSDEVRLPIKIPLQKQNMDIPLV